MSDIKKLRGEIIGIDEKIVRLLSERLELAEKIGKEKASHSVGLIDWEREEEVLFYAGKNAHKLGMDEDAVKRIFLEIISLSRSRQIEQFSRGKISSADVRIAFQGEPGAYSELAIKNNFPYAKTAPYPQFEDVFNSLENGNSDFALVPVENSTEGSVNRVYDLLLERDIEAMVEVFQRIEHMLIASVNAGKIERVYSYPQALAQCKSYLLKNRIRAEPFYDTAGAVKMIKEKNLVNAAAIASRTAAEIYGMKIIASGIEDNKNNYTRFLLVAHKARAKELAEKLKPEGKKYKTSLIFGLPNVPGALFSILKNIAEAKINLTKIESRPTKSTPWEYIFYIDFEGSVQDEKVKEVLDAVKAKMTFMKLIGSYLAGA